MRNNQLNTTYKFYKYAAYSSFAVFLLGGAIMLHPFTIDDIHATDTIITTNYSNDGEYVSTPVVSNDVNLDITGTPSGAYAGGVHTVSEDTNVDTYALYISTDNTDSTMVNNANDAYEISATSGTPTSLATLSTNSWGYALNSFNPGSNAETSYIYSDLAANNASTDQWNSSLWAKVPYAADPTMDVSTANKIFEHNSSMSQNNNNTDVYYAVKANNALAAGNYTATVTYTVVADVTNSEPTTLDEAEEAGYTMQQITQDMCANTRAYEETNKTYTLIDSRDDSDYKIRKLADGNCWMVQNLHLLDITVTSSDSDVSNDFTIPASINTYSRDSGQPGVWCALNSPGCVNKPLTYYNNNTTYGVYYNWYTATASSGTYSMSSGSANYSICPKGWKLPLGTTTTSSWYYLYSTSYSTTLSTFQAATNTGSGYWSGYFEKGLLNGVGTSGDWWSRTTHTGNNAYYMGTGSSGIFSQSDNNKYCGFSVRCVLTAAS